MRLMKVFLGFAFLLCLMEPCLLAAKVEPRGPPESGVIAEGLGRRIRSIKREEESQAEYPNTRKKREFAMLEKALPPGTG